MIEAADHDPQQGVVHEGTALHEHPAIMGARPDEAYYVKVGPATMSRNDINKGRLVFEFGIAALRPSDFVSFRISHSTKATD